MAQGGGGKNKTLRKSGGKAKQQKSKGSARKTVGQTKKNMRSESKDYLRDKAGKSFINAIENDMASRVPSDQRAKLTLLKAKGPIIKNRSSGKKKPLTRGRKRKDNK
uniref:Uncharacterized protein n=1 Tax=Neobodo designis TaxID=312471 RepID=A0A7S1Q6S7_NEODS|eukprot:CAMPEP_0174849390 /NCGR_PEP_ID=MMETSP1114-20130205/15538_1 /TAXON_ID=312471 /ORGANISM="Neobodo designis, Strain CCAP 1951/1" /LENGTH=106 /DNA_ID=CAMNT_0016083725 /DNA_START=30 /DNA_END=350 /DNA_ORIENTATION=+